MRPNSAYMKNIYIKPHKKKLRNKATVIQVAFVTFFHRENNLFLKILCGSEAIRENIFKQLQKPNFTVKL